MQQMFKDKVVIVTGGANGIGKCIADEFRKQGSYVYVIDRQEGDHFVGDISKKEVLEAFVAEVLEKHDRIDCIINNALPLMKGIDECSYEEFQYALSVGVTAPFYLVKLLMNHLAEGASIVNISSSRDRMSQPQTESYTAAKGGIVAGATRAPTDAPALKIDVANARSFLGKYSAVVLMAAGKLPASPRASTARAARKSQTLTVDIAKAAALPVWTAFIASTDS